MTVNAFSTKSTAAKHPQRDNVPHGSRTSSPLSSTTQIYSTNSEIGLETSSSSDHQDTISYPVQIIHQGHKTTINVHENEPILQLILCGYHKKRQFLDRNRAKTEGKIEKNGVRSKDR